MTRSRLGFMREVGWIGSGMGVGLRDGTGMISSFAFEVSSKVTRIVNIEVLGGYCTLGHESRSNNIH